MNSPAMTNAGGCFVPRVNQEVSTTRLQRDTGQTDVNRPVPASLFLHVDESDGVTETAIKETSDDYTRKYISWKVENVEGYDVIPDETIIEYRFPDRKAIPPFKPGFEKEDCARDLYYALDGKNIPGRYISLRVAAFLEKNNVDVLQSEDVYRRILKCPEYREFSWLNSNGLLAKPHLLNADDKAKLAAVRTGGGLPLAEIVPLVKRTGKPNVGGNRKTSPNIGNHPENRTTPSVNANGNIPTSLIMTIDRNDLVLNAAVVETSYRNALAYLEKELDRTDWDQIPNHTVVEYRFPDRASVPSLDPGAKNEYLSRDFYYSVDGMNIPRQYIPLPMAYYLSWNELPIFQPENVYRQVEQCKGFREFAYMNDRCLHRYPERKTKADAEALGTIRTSKAPVLSQLTVVRNYRDGWVANKSRKASSKTEMAPATGKKPYTPTRRIVANPVKAVNRKGMGL
jgi:hypothetical protein